MQLRDPESFAAQELRRKSYLEMKRKGKIPKTSVALQVLQCKMVLDSECALFYDDPYGVEDPTVARSPDPNAALSAPRVEAAAIPTCQQRGIIISGDIICAFEQMLFLFFKARRRCLFPYWEGSLLCS